MGPLARSACRDVVRFRWVILGLAVVQAIVICGLGARARTRATLLHTYEEATQRLEVADIEVHLGPTVRDAIPRYGMEQGIASTRTRLVLPGTLSRADRPPLPAVVRGLPPDPPRLHRLEILAGRYPRADEAAVVVDRSLQAGHGLGPGDKVEIEVDKTRLELPVVGVALFADHLVAPVHPEHVIPVQGSLAVVGLSHAAVGGLPHGDRVTSLLVQLAQGSDEERVGDLLRNDARLSIDHVVYAEERYDRVHTDLLVKAYDVYGPAVLFLLVITGLLLLVITLAHVVAQRRRQIGILLAHGFGWMEIAASFLGTALVSFVLGAIAGVLLHGPYARLVARSLMAHSAYPPLVDAGPQGALLLGIGGCLLASVLTSLAALLALARRPPARLLVPAMNTDGPSGRGWLGRVLAGVRAALHLPPPVGLGVANAARDWGTTVASAAGIGCGLTLVLTSIVVHVTARAEASATVRRWSRDATVHFREPASDSEVADLGSAVEGSAEPFVSRAVYVHDGKGGRYRQLLGCAPEGFAHALPVAEGRGVATLGPGEAVIDGWLAAHDGLSVGVSLLLYPAPNAPEGVQMTIVGILDGVSFGRIVTTLDDARALCDLHGAATGALITTELAAADLERRLWEHPKASAVHPTSLLASQVDAAFQGREVVLWLAAAAAVLISLAFLTIVTALDVPRRARHVAVLDSLGWRPGALAASIATEVTIRGALSVLVAVALAPFTTLWVIGVLTEAHGFRLVPQGSAGLYLSVLGPVLVLLPLAALPAWISARRLHPTQLLRGQ